MKEPISNEQGLPRGLTIGVMIVFATLVLGSCLLIVFLYNLPVLFPPPGTSGAKIGLATGTPSPLRPIPPATVPLPTATTVPSATPTRGPAAAPVSGRIVFVTERLGFNSIFIMNTDGSGQQLLVPHNGNYYDYAPAVAPNGRILAFSSNRERPGTDDIYVINLDGSGMNKITSTPGSKNASSSWFPDSRRLAFTSNRTGHWQVFTMNSDGSGVRQIIDSSQDSINVAVAPNGGMIAYVCGREICIANPDGSGQHVLWQNGLPKDHLAWSPDSSLLSFTQASPSSPKSTVNVLDMQGNTRQVISNGGWSNWSPDGRRLVFSSDMEGTANLYYYDLDSGAITRLTRTNAADTTPIWIR